MKKLTIAQIKSLLYEQQVDPTVINSLQHDKRKGVQKLLQSYRRQQQKEKDLKERFAAMTQFEKKCRQAGYHMIAGIDEAGRGPLAGPVVAAAVILPPAFELLGLNDSKQLSEARRLEYATYIKENAVSYGIGMVGHDQIDTLNILQATKQAMKQALLSLKPAADYVLIDAVTLSNLPMPFQSINKGDERSISIAAASILAKVTRDKWMRKIHQEYPMYEFASNMGYGTKQHLNALEEYGISPYHRKSFAPVKKYLKSE